MPTPNMGLTEPTDHGSTSIWGAALNAALDILDAHSHMTGSGVPIQSAALKINADVSWSFGGANYAVKDCKAIDFAPVTAASVAGFAGALFINSADSELYYRTTGGSNVKVTNGAALNFAAFVGGIGGDYSAVGALESFDDATKRYLFQSEGSPRPWSGMACADIDLYEKAASITNKVTLKSPGALAASYSVTLPAALPGATSLMQMSSAGVLSASMTLPSAPTAPDYKINGSGLIRIAPASCAYGNANTATIGSGLGPLTAWALTSAGAITFPAGLQVGDVITGYTVHINKTSNATKTVSARISDINALTAAQVDRGAGSSIATNAPGVTTFGETGLSITVGGLVSQTFLAVRDAGSGGDLIYGVALTYTRP